MRATRKFLDFVDVYRAPPPGHRPSPAFRIDWDQVPRLLKTIYSHRSKALHGGLPFPPSLPDPAAVVIAGEPPAEKPLGSATAQGDAVWQASETPMMLHVFEYITRSALLAWLHEPDRPQRS